MNLGKPGPFNFSMPVTWFMLALKESKKKPSLKKLVQKKKIAAQNLSVSLQVAEKPGGSIVLPS